MIFVKFWNMLNHNLLFPWFSHRIREWVARQAEREREKEERRQARLERRRAVPKHNFSDPNYEHQMSTVSDDIRDAVAAGMYRDQTY